MGSGPVDEVAPTFHSGIGYRTGGRPRWSQRLPATSLKNSPTRPANWSPTARNWRSHQLGRRAARSWHRVAGRRPRFRTTIVGQRRRVLDELKPRRSTKNVIASSTISESCSKCTSGSNHCDRASSGSPPRAVSAPPWLVPLVLDVEGETVLPATTVVERVAGLVRWRVLTGSRCRGRAARRGRGRRGASGAGRGCGRRRASRGAGAGADRRSVGPAPRRVPQRKAARSSPLAGAPQNRSTPCPAGRAAFRGERSAEP